MDFLNENHTSDIHISSSPLCKIIAIFSVYQSDMFMQHIVDSAESGCILKLSSCSYIMPNNDSIDILNIVEWVKWHINDSEITLMCLNLFETIPKSRKSYYLRYFEKAIDAIVKYSSNYKTCIIKLHKRCMAREHNIILKEDEERNRKIEAVKAWRQVYYSNESVQDIPKVSFENCTFNNKDNCL